MSKSAVVGISGGVDSAVCAALLLEQGYDVTGVFLDTGGDSSRAEEVCAALGIPLIIADAKAKLENLVIEPFIDGYKNCLTPNPCVICNPLVKYSMLVETADKLGAFHIATGHYAGVAERGGVHYIRKGCPGRDQSYMLYRLPEEIISRCLFPVGDMPKDTVRAKAAELKLSVANAPDSMEICFVPDGDYAAFIRSRGHSMPEGDIVDVDGNILGRHRGL
ncbi:MAG: tRNA-specific 2-thiouridylase, partial [Oscillospiraceae bacterium]|nr:tRNA-specific 2-thiouridylase [Oscillospiraceae bacterium]